MRAMILAAGLGTRMAPLSGLRAKPALPVRGRPVVSLLLELLAGAGVREVLVNLHHLPETIRSAV
ncbi:MAG: sugar phosphate nucleotidyltransferase, partial [Myxococcota bacterium]